mgnify:CR=1 FL=1
MVTQIDFGDAEKTGAVYSAECPADATSVRPIFREFLPLPLAASFFVHKSYASLRWHVFRGSRTRLVNFP